MADDEQRRFERLFHEHYDAVLAYALLRTDPDGAKDAAAQTFLVAWRRRAEIPEWVRPWLLGVARRTLADQRRASARRGNLTSRLSTVRSGDSRDPAEQVVDADGVIAAFLQLREADREVLRLVAWDRLTPTDAARVLGCSKPTFAVRLSRARRRFEAALAAADTYVPMEAR